MVAPRRAHTPHHHDRALLLNTQLFRGLSRPLDAAMDLLRMLRSRDRALLPVAGMDRGRAQALVQCLLVQLLQLDNVLGQTQMLS